MSPETALSESVALSGERRHRRIAYDDTFRILTLPSPPRPAVKIMSPGKIGEFGRKGPLNSGERGQQFG